ncbi:Gfo/Idh/MocA family oxidoreductase [Patescibacteria group bacterium]|nr:Gfo/Idh/MocA family oxidoreductase [Patescibacteria group bacterium]MBU1970378.1 Gfo/Idh/MocA family oxidoreductase [Patescibacteria group bacterium]
MTSNLRTAVIGAGTMGSNHARLLMELTELVAIIDINKNKGLELAQKYDANFYLDITTALEQEKLDAAVIAVPTYAHAIVALRVLNRRVPVLLEKPISDNILEARKVINTAKKLKTVLMIGHIERYNPVIKKLKAMIDSDEFGKILSIQAIRVGISPPKTINSDVVLDLGIHDIDLINFLLDETPRQYTVYKNKLLTKNRSDYATVALQYRHTNASVQTNWVTPVKIRKLMITGTKLYGEVDNIDQKLTIWERNAEIKLKNGFYDFVSSFNPISKQVPIKKGEPLKEELLYFLKLVNNQHYEDCSYALNALKITLNENN